MRSTWPLLVTLFVLAMTDAAVAGAPVAERASDLSAKIGVWEGRWTYSGRIYKTVYSDAHSDSGTIDCAWAKATYMVCNYASDDPPHDNLSIFAYSPAAKSLVHVGISRDLKPLWEKVSLQGDTWSTRVELPYDGKTIVVRDDFVFLSADKHTTTESISADGGRTWTTIIKTTAVKSAS